MNAPIKRLAAAVCGLLLGLPLAQAENYLAPTDVFIQFGTTDNAMKVSPAELALVVGQPYRIVLINSSEDSHIVAASEELAATMRTSSLLKGTPRIDYPTGVITNGIELGPGEMLEWSFTPLQEGDAKIGCATPLHAELGMHTMIKVVHDAL